MQPPPSPKLTGKPPEEVRLTGKVMPWLKDIEQPATISLISSDLLYLPVWDRPGDLESFMAISRQPYDTIKQIDDGMEFLKGLAESGVPSLRVAINLRFVDSKIRYVELNPNDPLYLHELQ